MEKINGKVEGTETKKESVITSVSVDRVKRDSEGIIRFTLIVNGVSIYGCRWIEGNKNGKDYALVSFPSYKSGDKYYNNAYVYLTSEDTEKINGLLVEALNNIAD